MEFVSNDKPPAEVEYPGPNLLRLVLCPRRLGWYTGLLIPSSSCPAYDPGVHEKRALCWLAIRVHSLFGPALEARMHLCV